jgi:hypothetical protein
MLHYGSNFVTGPGVFKDVRELDLCVTIPQCLAMLEAEEVCSKLCKLHLVKDPDHPLRTHSLAPLTLLLRDRHLSQLTALWVDRDPLMDGHANNNAAAHLSRAITACPGLKEMRMEDGNPPGQRSSTFARSVLARSTLRTLDCFVDDDPKVTILSGGQHQEFLFDDRLTQLKSLGFVVLRSVQAVRALARLVQLTELSFDVRWGDLSSSVPQLPQGQLQQRVGDHEGPLKPLTSLTSLQVLCIYYWMEEKQLMELVQPLQFQQLRELECWLKRPSIDKLDELLDNLPSISSFRMFLCKVLHSSQDANSYYIKDFPKVGYRVNGFRRLRHLSITLRAGKEGIKYVQLYNFRNALKCVESLNLHFYKYRHLYDFLAPDILMPRLYELELSTDPDEHDVVVYPSRMKPAMSARFLQMFPQLRSLTLKGVLNGWIWETDVRFISQLKDLKHLKVYHRYAPDETRIAIPVNQVMPLTALRYLECLSLSSPWEGAVSAEEFRDALEKARRVLGLPNTMIDIVHTYGTGIPPEDRVVAERSFSFT